MIKSLYSAATGMNAQQTNIEVIANNIANLYLLRGKYAEAQKYYEKAAQLGVRAPYSLVNLAVCHQRQDRKDKAAEAFQRAVAMDSEIGQKYRAMALELLGGI